MTALTLVIAIAATAPVAGTAMAMSKCTAPNGGISYVEGECPHGTKSASLRAPSKRREPATPEYELETRYYDIEGSSEGALFAAMSSRGPDGYHGRTTWNVAYSYYGESRDGHCVAERVGTLVRGLIVLPRWVRRDGASSELIARWQRVEAALREHEQGHLDHGLELARVVLAEFSKAKARDCAQLDLDLRGRFSELLRAYRKRDVDYDVRTQHGRTQGTWFESTR